jgi:hypothetical protein
MNPHATHPLTLVDYYALALAPTFYSTIIDQGGEQGTLWENLTTVRVALFKEAQDLATMSLNSRTPREGSHDNAGAGAA